MISGEFRKYHGAVLSVLASTKPYITFNKLEGFSQGEYQINPNNGLYIKHATSGENTWLFNFQPGHQDEVRHLSIKYREKILIALVCVNTADEKDIIDGVCLIDFVEFSRVTHPDSNCQKTITVRRDGGSYWVSGTSGSLPMAVAKNRFPEKIIALVIS